LRYGFTVPIQAQPFQPGGNRIDGFLGGALTVGVFDAQQELPAHVLGVQVIEQRRAGAADVQKARGGRGKACYDSHGFKSTACSNVFVVV